MSSWQENLRIILVAPRNALNIGAAARAMYNFGFTDLRCVLPYELAFRKARSSVGATSVLEKALATDNLPDALGDSELVIASSSLADRKQRHVHRVLPAGATAIRTHLEDRKAALVFGSEKYGLTNDDLSHCNWVMTIPTNQECPSMNLGQAVAICCYEIARIAVVQPKLKTPVGVSVETRERILNKLLPILEESGFMNEDGNDQQIRKLRRFVSRLRLAPEDVRILQAILHQVDWKLNRSC